MKDAYGGAWLFGLVITFMVIFIGFLVVMINYAMTFKTKNEVVAIIEKYEGLANGDYTGSMVDLDGDGVPETKSQPNSLWLINTYLKSVDYENMSTCSCVSESNCYGSDNLDIYTPLKIAKANEKYYYCVQYTESKSAVADEYGMPSGYFDVELFFSFDIPIISSFPLGRFSVKGQTNKLRPVVADGLEGL